MTPVNIVAAAENPLLPALYDIIWSAVCLLIVFLVVWKYVLPAFNRTLDERAARIEGGIAKAEQAQKEAVEAKRKYEEQLSHARVEASKIRDDARADAERIVEEMRQNAEEEAERIKRRGEETLENARLQVVRELKSELGSHSNTLAEQLVRRELESDEAKHASVDSFLDELERSTGSSGSSASSTPAPASSS